jgi:hypothetical protein
MTFRSALAALSLASLLGPYLAAAQAPAPRTPAPAGVTLYFIGLEDGDEVTSPVEVRFGLRGMGVAPAGLTVANTGHHHLVIDSPTPDPSQPIPTDAKHLHFGAGQTETSLTLPPGEHTLQLVLGDHVHRPHDPPVVSKVIRIRVK